MNRLVAAWHVLMGTRVTHLQIQSEWIEYKQVFNDQLERLSSYLARSAKAEKKRLERIQADLGEAIAPPQTAAAPRDRRSRKNELFRRAVNQIPHVIGGNSN